MGLKERNFLEATKNQKIFNEKRYSEDIEFEDVEIDISEFKQIEEILNEDDENYAYLEDNDGIDMNEDGEDLNAIYEDIEKKKCESKYKLITRRIDSNKIRHKTAKNLEVSTSILKNIRMDAECGPIRSGAIIYTHFKGKTYFCLGVDSSYGDLTDFAGGVKKDENIIEGGLRELEEESQGIFGKISVKEVENCMGFYTTNMLIMFIRREIDMDKSKETFLNQINKCSLFQINNGVEVSGVVWLESKEFIESILGKGRRLYSRVRRILTKVVSIIEAL